MTNEAIKFVLIGDEEEETGKLLSLVAREQGFSSVIVHSTEEAGHELAHPRSYDFALAVIDLSLPTTMNRKRTPGGRELIEQLRRNPGPPFYDQFLPVYDTTGADLRESDATVLQLLGVDKFLKKPLNANTVAESFKLASALREQRQRDFYTTAVPPRRLLGPGLHLPKLGR